MKELEEILSYFECSLDKKIEKFLKNTAIDLENKRLARTFIVVDNKASNEEFLLGYFTLTTKVIFLSKDISGSQYKKFTGSKNKNSSEPLTTILIGQLSKNTRIKNNPLNGEDLLGLAINLIHQVTDIVGGRAILIECQDNPKIKEFYVKNGFKEVQLSTASNNNLLKFVKFI